MTLYAVSPTTVRSASGSQRRRRAIIWRARSAIVLWRRPSLALTLGVGQGRLRIGKAQGLLAQGTWSLTLTDGDWTATKTVELRGETAPAERYDPRKTGVRQIGNPRKKERP